MNNAATDPANEIMIVRKTADGASVEFWTDGAVGVGSRSHSKIFARAVPRQLAWLIAEEVPMFNEYELRALFKAARRAWDKHTREPHRVRLSDVRRIMLAYAPVGESW